MLTTILALALSLPATAAETSPRETNAQATPAAASDDRRWYPLGNGYQGFGRLNAAGQLVTEWHYAQATGQVVRGPAPIYPVPTPAVQPQLFRYYYPSAFGGGCSTGTCPR